jgi:spermidine synthase
MTQSWETLDCVDTPDGELKLLRRGEGDFLITIAGRVLMNSRANRSELAVAKLPCQKLAARQAPRVLVGGLGMGCTLRAALDALPEHAEVTVVELHRTVETWCRDPLALVCGNALSDARVTVSIEDVSQHIRRRADERALERYDAIILDLYEGPHAKTDAKRDPLYGQGALDRVARSLRPQGLFSVWSEDPDTGFERRLRRAGFQLERVRPGRGGRRHAVYLAQRLT